MFQTMTVKDIQRAEIEFKIKSAQRTVTFWEEQERIRKRNELKLSEERLFSFIHKAKAHKKEAQSELAYWKRQLANLE